MASILNNCVKEYDHFPSISQFEAIIDKVVQREIPSIPLRHPPPPPPRVPGYTLAHEGLFIGFEQRGYPSSFGMSYCKISDDEFLEVYHDWKNRKIHPAATRIKGNEKFIS